MVIYESVTELVGKTPLLHAKRLSRLLKVRTRLLLKLEYLNPAGSVKDRVAKAIIEDAEKSGRLKQGGLIVEPTSGNTGIGLAAVAAAKGYRVIITMPDTMSAERIKLMEAYGAKIVLTDGALGMAGAISEAEKIAAETSGAIIAGQFTNKVNPEVHRLTTGPEIWKDTDGNVDAVVVGVGTGGTVTGVGEFLKSKNPDIKIIAVEPADSPVLTEGRAGTHKIQGIGAGFVPEILNTEIYDEIITVDTDSAYEAARELAAREGILVGISSGAALHATLKISERKEYEGKTVVVVLPDTGDRYLSTPLFG